MTADTPPKIYTRAELASLLVGYNYGSKAQMRKIVDDLFEAMAGILERGHVIYLKDFGCFAPNDTPERLGRNPKTGEPHVIPAGRRIKFKPSAKRFGGRGAR